MAAAARLAAGSDEAMLRAIRELARAVEDGQAEARRAASDAREAAEAAAEEAKRVATEAAAEAHRVAAAAAESARQNHAEAVQCHAAAMLSQEQMEARVVAQQKEVAEAQAAHVLVETQRMLDELLAKMPKPAPPPPPPPPPPKPCMTDRGVQCGGWDRGLQAGGVDETTQHDPLLADMACQTEAPPPAKPLIVPLASSVGFNAFSAELPRKPADIFWYHQVHAGPPGTKQGRYVRQ